MQESERERRKSKLLGGTRRNREEQTERIEIEDRERERERVSKGER